MILKKYKYVVTGALFLLGIIISMQVRVTALNKSQNYKQNKVDEIKATYFRNENTIKALDKQISINENKIKSELKSDASVSDWEANRLLKDIATTNLIAGLTDVKGSGVVIWLSDSKTPTSPLENNNIIHDKYLFGIVNELKKAGAQAISINDERITSVSEQVCTGPNIRINGNKYPVPYEIKAIGDGARMKSQVENSVTYAELAQPQTQVSINIVNNVLIKKYYGDIDSIFSGLEVYKGK
jgi:uncharacterized protein YlxW (UPF0749 family)